jgi:predicted nucleotidyltransferase
MDTSAADLARLGGPVSRLAGLGLLLLFGSRARGDAAEWADWDFGYVGASALDAAALLSALVEATGSDRVDLVDLRRAGGLLRHRAALDGLTVFEVRPGLADEFRLEAAAFWCDAAPVLERAYDSVLAELPR